MKIALIGDIALFGCNNATVDFESKFSIIRKCLSEYDCVIGNLETPLTNATKVVGGKSAYIKGKPSDVEILNYLGITHVSLSNNHVFDYCINGLNDTVSALDNAGIKWYGIQGKTEIIENSNTGIRLRGYCCYSTNGKGMEHYIDVFDPFRIEKDIETDYRDGLIPLLSIHWGQEHVHYPNYDHVLTARKLASKTPIIIHGHHPHVLQGIEEVDGSFIAYSLGNFCFDDVYTKKSTEPLIKLSTDNKETIILGIEVVDNKISNVEIRGFIFDKDSYTEMPSIEKKINGWSQFLRKNETEFRSIRDSELKEYIEGRKKKRDVQWYLKRMNLESFRMILSSRNNKKEYRRLVEGYIKDRTYNE